jgi:biotin synthase-like enzyme
MSTQKPKIKNPKLARRTKESILAEALLCKLLNWKIEFLSGGYESYDFRELTRLIKDIKKIYGKKLWLNIGTLNQAELKALKPYIKGVSGAVECINPALRKKLCPSKPLKDIETMLHLCDKLNLKKSMTIILGLGESEKDIPRLKSFIKKHNIDQITFYRLKPQKDTIFEKAKPISKKYYAEWIKQIKTEFPKIKIIAGSWLTHLDEISLLLKSGAEGITKFPAIKRFGSKYAKQIEKQVRKAGMALESNLTKKTRLKIPKNLDQIVSKKLKSYIQAISI